MGGKGLEKGMPSLGTFVGFERSCGKNAVPETKGWGGSQRGMLGWVTVQYNFGHLESLRDQPGWSVNSCLPRLCLPSLQADPVCRNLPVAHSANMQC